MKTKTKFIIITIVLAIISFSLSKVIWPDSSSMSMPTARQLPFFIFISALESLSFGIGVAFVLLGWKYLKALMPENKKGAVLSFFAITWLLVSWWPHDNMHRVNGPSNMAGLLRIEFIFHFTLIIAGFILAYNFWRLVIKSNILQFTN